VKIEAFKKQIRKKHPRKQQQLQTYIISARITTTQLIKQIVETKKGASCGAPVWWGG